MSVRLISADTDVVFERYAAESVFERLNDLVKERSRDSEIDDVRNMVFVMVRLRVKVYESCLVTELVNV